MIIICDEKGNPTGEYIPKIEGVTGEGKKHLAITVVIYNKNGQVLLQKRKHLVFDNLWDLTASTDLSHFKDRDETFEEAAQRCLKREWGVEVDVKQIGGFSYFAKDGEHCENEYDMILVGEYSGEVELNHEVGYEYKWAKKQDFLVDLKANPQNYTPWAIEAVKLLKERGFFN